MQTFALIILAFFMKNSLQKRLNTAHIAL